MGPLVRVFVALILCSCLTSVLLSCSGQITNPPQVVAVSVCPDLTPGTRRIPSDFGIRFDAPEKVFMVQAAVRDMPPERCTSSRCEMAMHISWFGVTIAFLEI